MTTTAASWQLHSTSVHAVCWWGQALLDVYTILREVGKVDNVRIALVGDLANGRTARSLAYLLSMYKGVKMYFVAPDVVRMGADIKEFLDSKVSCATTQKPCDCLKGRAHGKQG